MRRTALATGLLLLCGAAAAVARDNDFSKVEIKVQKVAGSIYMLTGAGGNIGVSVGEDGIVIVDDQFAPLADRIRAALAGISDKPVRFVINTHWHGDHVGGNLPFSRTSTIIAQDNVRRRMAERGTSGNLGSMAFKTEASPAAALPIITFDHDLTVHLNGEDIRALHYPAGHTDGDSIIFFTKSNVVHMGDDFVTRGFPFVDLASGGSVHGMIAAVASVLDQLPPDARVIPGHGTLSTVADMRPYLAMLKETSAAVETALKKGETLDQMRRAKILTPWQKWSGDFIDTDKWLETLYNDLSGKGKGRFMKHN